MNEKEYWEQVIMYILLIFATYTITKDMVDENTVPIISLLFNSATITAIFYAGIVDTMIFWLLSRKWKKIP